MSEQSVHLLYEKNAITKLFFNKELRDKYVPSMLTAIFVIPQHRLIAHIISLLHGKIEVLSIESIVMAQSSEKVKSFRWKYNNLEILTIDSVHEIIYNLDVNNSTEQFKEIWKQLYNDLWDDKIQLMGNAMLKCKEGREVLAYANGIIKVHRILNRHKYTTDSSQIRSAATKMNSARRILPFFSKTLNRFSGGFTCGYPNAIIGRGEHGKSTFVSYDIIWKIDNNIIDKADVILCEEDIVSFWSRVFAYKFNIPLLAIKKGTMIITDEQVKYIEKLYSNRINVFPEMTEYNDVIDTMFASTAEYISIDHINAIAYPGKGTPLMNMIGGIPGLINKQKEYLKNHKETAMVNLCQVNEKELMKKPGLWKNPSTVDAYGGTTINQVAREVLCVYYPFKDMVRNSNQWVGKFQNKAHGEKDYYVTLDKANIGTTGEVHMTFNNEIGSFADYEEPVIMKKGIDKALDTLELFKEVEVTK